MSTFPRAEIPETKTPLVVFSDDWGRHPSSCQHLVRRLLPEYPVWWVNTVGTRPPRLDRYSVERGLEKLRAWLAPPLPGTGSEANPRVLNPLMWPSFAGPVGRAVNARLIGGAVRRALGGAEPGVALTTVPVVADLVGRLPVERWVYYCVDDLSEWPGLDRGPLERLERELVGKVDAVIAASERLAERMAALGCTASLLTHGVEPDFWAAPGRRAVPAIEPLPRPLVAFWGVVDRRLELEWIERLSEVLGQGSIVLAGPVVDADAKLGTLRNVHLIGPLAYEALPTLGHEASVLIMPYVDREVTRAMQPLKLKEYLATGKPVVARDLPALGAWRGACDVVATAETFVRTVATRISGELPPAQAAARERLQQEAWAAKARVFEAVLFDGMS